MLLSLATIVTIYAFLVCKIFGPKIWSCKTFDKFHVCQCIVKNLAQMCLMWLFSTANKSAQIYKLYAFIGQEWVSTVWGGNQHKQVHQFHRFSHLCIQENHITTHPLLIHSQQNKQSGSSCNRFAWLSLNFFRCASISWFQVVSRWVIEWLIFFGFKASASVGRLSIYLL